MACTSVACIPIEVRQLQAQGRKLCEFTKLAVDESVRSQAILGAIFHVACIYVINLHRCTDVLIEVNPRHVRFYERMLGLSPRRRRAARSRRQCAGRPDAPRPGALRVGDRQVGRAAPIQGTRALVLSVLLRAAGCGSDRRQAADPLISRRPQVDAWRLRRRGSAEVAIRSPSAARSGPTARASDNVQTRSNRARISSALAAPENAASRSALASISARSRLLPGSPLGSSTRACERAAVVGLDRDLADPAARVGGIDLVVELHARRARARRRRRRRR